MFRQGWSETLRKLSRAARREAFAPLDPFAQVARMGRGLNILGYDPIWDDFRSARFRKGHFQMIRAAGFHAVRINLHAFRHMNAHHRLSGAWLKTLDWAVQNALANDLHVILDEHDFRACGADLDASRPKLLAFWEQVSERYKDAPHPLVFELLNEPNTQLTAEAWNVLLREALAIVRKSNPQRNVVIGAAAENEIHFHHLDKLQLPDSDRNLIVTVHYYLPMEFTHQGARWHAPTANLAGVAWGREEEKLAVTEDFRRIQEWAEKHRRPILLGEFGTHHKGDMDSRACYTAWVARTAESLGWAWTYYQFDSNFAAWDMAGEGWVEPIRKALVP